MPTIPIGVTEQADNQAQPKLFATTFQASNEQPVSTAATTPAQVAQSPTRAASTNLENVATCLTDQLPARRQLRRAHSVTSAPFLTHSTAVAADISASASSAATNSTATDIPEVRPRNKPPLTATTLDANSTAAIPTTAVDTVLGEPASAIPPTDLQVAISTATAAVTTPTIFNLPWSNQDKPAIPQLLPQTSSALNPAAAVFLPSLPTQLNDDVNTELPPRAQDTQGAATDSTLQVVKTKRLRRAPLIDGGSQQLQSEETSDVDNKLSQSATTTSYLNTTGTPLRLLRRKMIGKKLHFLTKFSDQPKSIWIKGTDLPSDMIAQLLARMFEKRKRLQRQRSQFGQR
jgi:hypothetical protein